MGSWKRVKSGLKGEKKSNKNIQMIVPSTLKVVAVLSLYTADLFHDAIPYTYIDNSLYIYR